MDHVEMWYVQHFLERSLVTLLDFSEIILFALTIINTDKEIKNLVDQIHDCGYLDNIPEFPEPEEVPAVTVAPAEEQASTGIHKYS